MNEMLKEYCMQPNWWSILYLEHVGGICVREWSGSKRGIINSHSWINHSNYSNIKVTFTELGIV
jgi:hypothetical protein